MIALAPGSVIAAVRGKVSSLSAGAVNQTTLAEYPAGFVPGCDLVLARGDGENKLNFYFLNVQTNLANNQLEVSVANYGADEETDFEIFDVSSPITGF